MGRLVLVDADSVRVCALDGAPVPVPGPPEPDGRGGTRAVWVERVERGLDNARMMWDGSFLWVSGLQLRETEDNQVKRSDTGRREG
jgi:hypothetical protein